MLKLGDIVFRGSSHTLQHTDGYLRYDSRRQITPNLENSPINVGYQNRFYPPPPSYATETAAIYHRMIHDAYQFVYGIYGEVDAYQSLTGGSFTKVIHKGKGDAHYVALMRPSAVDPGGFGYEAAMFTNGGNGFIATLQGQLGFPDSEPNQNNAVGFQALWGDDGVDPGFVPNYGMFYANNSPGHAFMARLNQFANPSVPQIMVTEPSFRIRHAIFGSGTTHLYGDAATVGSINKQSPDLVLRGHFWDGTNSISIERQSLLRTVVSVIGRPQMYHYFGAPGLETLGMISDAYGLDLQGHALTGVASITSAIGGMTLDMQGGDIVSLDDITFSGSGSLVDVQGGRITGGGSILRLGGDAASSNGLGAGDAIVGGALEVDGQLYADGQINTPRIFNGAAALNLGITAASNHGLVSGGTLVGGAFEVDGLSYFDSNINVSSTAVLNIATDSGIFLGDTANSVLWYTSTHTPDTLVLGVPFTSNALVIAERGDFNFDFAHPFQSDPTVFIHSSNNVTNQWLGLTHDKNKGRITAGFGVINLGKAAASSNNLSTGSVLVGDHLEVDGHIWVDGYLTTGAGNSLLLAPQDGYVSPAVDDGYSLGSQTRRWKDLWVGPGSIHLYQPQSTGTERDWNIGIGAGGSLSIRQSADLLTTITSSGDIQAAIASGPAIRNVGAAPTIPTILPNRSAPTYGLSGDTGSVRLVANGASRLIMDANGNVSGLVTWQYGDHSGVGGGSSITWGAGLDTRIHYNTTQTPNSWVFEVGTESRGLIITEFGKAGTNFLHPLQNNPTLFIQSANVAQGASQWISFAHNQDDGYIQTGKGSIYLAPANQIVKIDGYLNPSTDDAYSLGSQTRRWRELWVGPDSLHIYQPASTGLERDWNLRISSGDLAIRQSGDTKVRFTANNDTLLGGGSDAATLQMQWAGGNFFSIARQSGSTQSSGILDGAGTYGGIGINNGGVSGTLRGIWVNQVLVGSNFGSSQTANYSSSAILGNTGTITWTNTSFTNGVQDTSIRKSETGILRISHNTFDQHKNLYLGHNSIDGYIGNETGNLRINSNRKIVLEPLDGYVVPFADDGYSLGSPTQRWKDLWLGPDSLHIYRPFDPDIGPEREWNLGIHTSGHFMLRQADQAKMAVDLGGTLHLGGDVGTGIRFNRVNNTTFNVVSGDGSTNFFQSSTTGIILLGGTANWNSSGLSVGANSWRMWVVQNQDSLQDVRLIGSANAAGEYAARIGTRYSLAEGGDNATLLQIGLDMDGTPVGTHEFYGDGRFATKSSTGHAIILRHTGQDGYIQTTLGHISLAPQDGYVNPMTDDAYSLGSPTQRWKELWLGPDSLHIQKPADTNGIERDWRLGIGNAGSFVLKQGNDQGLLITPQNIGSLALGYGANVSNGSFHTAIGSGARASNVNNFNVAIGYNSSSTGPSDIAIGTTASSSGGSSVVMGFGATSAASQTTVIGYAASAGASASASVAIGYNTPVTGSNSIAIGTGAPAIGASAVAIGVGTGGAGVSTTTVGTGIANGSSESIAMGANAGSSADRGITIGNGSSALSSIGNGTGSISIGYTAASDGGGIAIGYQASSNYNQVNRSIAIGYNATTLSFANSLAVGESARPAEHNQAQFGTIAEPLNTVIYGSYLALNNNNKSILLRHIGNDGYIQTTSGHLILAPADGEVVPAGDAYGFGNPNNRWYDGYFTDTNTRGFVTDIVHIISANSPYTAKQTNYTILGNATGGNIVINLPGAGGANQGRIYNIKKTDSSGNTVTIQPSGAQTIDGASPVTLGTQNHARQIQSDGLNWYVIGGVF